MKLRLFIVVATALFMLSGCGAAKPKPVKQEVQKEHQYKIGKTTINEVMSKLGNPSGRSYNAKGEDILVYNSRHLTGKSFIPFYYGSDRIHMKMQKFTFSKDGVLTNYTVDERHY